MPNYSQKRHRLVVSCQFCQLVATCRKVATSFLKSGLSLADLLQLVETICSKSVYEKF